MSGSSSPPSNTGNQAFSAYSISRKKTGSSKGGKIAQTKSAVLLTSSMMKKSALAKPSVSDAVKTLTTKKTGSSHGAEAHKQGIPKTKKALPAHIEKTTAGDPKGKTAKSGPMKAEKGEASVKGKIDRGGPHTSSSASKYGGTSLSKRAGYYKGDKGFNSKAGGEAAGGQTGSGNIASGLGTAHLKPGSNAGSGRLGMGYDKAAGHDDEIGAPVVGLSTGRRLSYAVTAASMFASSGDAIPNKDAMAAESDPLLAQIFRHHMVRLANETDGIFRTAGQLHILATFMEGTESSFWQQYAHEDLLLLVTRGGVAAAEAVEDVFTNADDFVLDSGSAVALVAARAELATVGRQAFDWRHAEGLIIGGMPDGGHFASSVSGALVGLTSKIMETGSSRWMDRTNADGSPRQSPFDPEQGDQLIAGDVYAFARRERKPGHPIYKAVIYLGENAEGAQQFWQADEGIVNVTLDAREQTAIADGPLEGYDLTALRLEPPALPGEE